MNLCERRDRMHPAGRLLILALAAWTLLGTGMAFGMGKKEDSLRQADALIAQKRYNEAIAFLTDFIKKNPERFDEAQIKLREIIRQRESYNVAGNALVDTLINDPTNSDKIVALTNELRRQDPNNPGTADFVEKTRLANIFFVYRRDFNDIMTRGRAEIDAARYAQAAAIYETGFRIYREEFDTGPYDALTKSAVAALVDRVKTEVAAYAASQTELAASVERLRAGFAAGGLAAIDAAWPAAEAALLDRARRRNSVVQAGRAMARQFEVLQAIDAAKTDSSFLPFAFRVTLGRPESSQPEGIAGAMDTQWVALLTSLQTPLEERLEASYARAEEAYEGQNWEEAALGLEWTAALAERGLKAMGLWSLVAPTDLLPEPTAYGRAILTGKAPAYERIRHLGKAAAGQARLARIALRAADAHAAATRGAEALPANAPLSEALALFAERRAAILAEAADIQAEREPARLLAEELARWSSAGYGDERATRVQGSYDGRLAALALTVRDYEIALAARASGYEFARLEADYTARAASLAEGRRLLDGIPAAGTATGGAAPPEVATPMALGAPPALLYYPSKSAEILAGEESLLKELRARLSAYIQKLERETPYIASAPAVQIWTEKARNLERQTGSLQTEREAALARAIERKRAAESARLEAERRTQEAQRALAGEDFDLARDRLGKAREKYLVSLAFEDNAALRASSDRTLQKLGEDIVKAENERVIRDTRRLITEGKTFYFQGVFDRAEDSLLRARARWKTTHGDETEPEVEYWLKLVQAALSVKTGRDIPPTAPLYPEMSQLLSLAKRYYEEGRSLLAQRKKTDALQYFALAKQKINEVKVVFPLNQEAGVLALRIDQLTDPEAFKIGFQAKFTSARSRLETDPRAAYSELQDLATIDPKYPGMQAALERAEILLGIRLPPPDPARARRAAELVAAARRIVDSGDSGRFAFALEQLNEAIQLDPNNAQAVSLKDRILTFQGGTAQIVLSSYAEEQYRLAVEAFQNGNYLQANAIMERLLQDPKNKKSEKLLDLYKKIQARL